jgi:hypothetical protein
MSSLKETDYKTGSFKFLKEGGTFDYAQVTSKKGEVIYIFLDPRDDTWYLLHDKNTEFNIINLNRFVHDPYYQYKKDQRAKEALEEFNS